MPKDAALIDKDSWEDCYNLLSVGNCSSAVILARNGLSIYLRLAT